MLEFIDLYVPIPIARYWLARAFIWSRYMENLVMLHV